MSGALELFARRWWAGEYGAAGRLLGWITVPLSWLWAIGFALRDRRLERRGATRVEGVRVVSVGNLAVGGTGKTPLASWVVRAVSAPAGEAALVLNGYGEDEERLHGTWTPGIPVYADRDRVLATRRAAAEGGRVVVLDDGFQHRRLARNVDVVLIAVEDPLPVRLLPRGPYREGLDALERADAVVCTRRGRSTRADAERLLERLRSAGVDFEDQVIASVHLAPGALQPLHARPGASPPSGAVHVVTGIARPDDFIDDVEGITEGVAGVTLFRDHHPFSRADAVRIRARAGTFPLVMTEKDAVKLRSYARELDDAWVLTQQLRWDWGEEALRGLVAREGTVAEQSEEGR